MRTAGHKLSVPDVENKLSMLPRGCHLAMVVVVHWVHVPHARQLMEAVAGIQCGYHGG